MKPKHGLLVADFARACQRKLRQIARRQLARSIARSKLVLIQRARRAAQSRGDADEAIRLLEREGAALHAFAVANGEIPKLRRARARRRRA
jgi:hypothetical protein